MLLSLSKSTIKKRLKGYKVAISSADKNLPFIISKPKTVAVIGGGIAGISAAANLGERGFQVDLYEKDSFLGGKLGAWSFISNGETLKVEHGFHAFFRQYFNLREFMKKIGAYQHLIPIDDYVIFYKEGTKQSFKGMETTPLLNVLSMGKMGVYRYSDMVLNRYGTKLLDLFKFDAETTFQKYDSVSLSKFMQDTHVPEKMKIVFSSFARAFFAQPDDMSTAELMKSFHFYFLSNDLGLIYDVLDDDFNDTFLSPAAQYLKENNTNIHFSSPVEKIEKESEKFIVAGKMYDYCVLATDVKHLPTIVSNSPYLLSFSSFSHQIKSLKTSARYAVWRIWTDKFEKEEYPFFIFTDRFKCLDSITLYHEMEKTSIEWSKKNNGGIFELHSYALPEDVVTDEQVKEAFLQELFHYLPELKGLTIKHEYFQHRNDFSAFHTGLYQNRPTIETEIPGLYLAGDWVKMNNSTMLLEAAYTSGGLAANYILKEEGLRENALESVPNRGLMA